MKTGEPVFYRQPITQWPEEERPRERLMNIGALRMSDAELLAILIRTGSGQSSAVDLARELLVRSCGLSALARMDFRQIHGLGVKGIGITKAITIAAAMHLGWRFRDNQSAEPEVIIRSSDQLAESKLTTATQGALAGVFPEIRTYIEDAAEEVYAGGSVQEALAKAKALIDQALVDYKELMGG